MKEFQHIEHLTAETLMPDSVIKIIADNHLTITDRGSLEKRVGHWVEWPELADGIIKLCVSYHWPNENWCAGSGARRRRGIQKAREIREGNPTPKLTAHERAREQLKVNTHSPQKGSSHQERLHNFTDQQNSQVHPIELEPRLQPRGPYLESPTPNSSTQRRYPDIDRHLSAAIENPQQALQTGILKGQRGDCSEKQAIQSTKDAPQDLVVQRTRSGRQPKKSRKKAEEDIRQGPKL
jgi:hypothetical protein